MPTAGGVLLFVALLAVWGTGAGLLYVVALLSVSTTIINAMIGIAAVCLVGSLILFFIKRYPYAFLFAAGPYLTVLALLVLGMLLS